MRQMVREIWDEIKGALSPVFVKRTRGGWIVFGVVALFFLSNKQDDLSSFFGKMARTGATLKVLVGLMQSPAVQVTLFVVGAMWIGIAAIVAGRRRDPFEISSDHLKQLQDRRAELLMADHKPARPGLNPLIVALEELDAIYAEGDHLATLFQCKGATVPTFPDAVAWNDKAIAFVKQEILKDHISPQDWAKFKENWSFADCQKIERILREHGFLDNATDSQCSTLRFLWGRVKRLGELIAKIKGLPADENKTPIESLTDFLLKVHSLLDASANLARLLPQAERHELVANIRQFLRGAAPEYVAGYNELVEAPPARTMEFSSDFTEEEKEEWTRTRREPCDQLHAIAAYLTRIISDLTSKLPSSHLSTDKPRPENTIRPNLILLDQGVSINADGGTCFFFTVKNIGSAIVKRAEFVFVIQTTRLAKSPVVQHEPTNQPIIEGTSRQIRYTFPKVDPEPAYIAFYVSYTGEGEEVQWDNDPVFLIWRGIKGNTIHLTLEYLRDEEINKFKDYLRKYEFHKPLLRASKANEEPSLYKTILEGIEARGARHDEQQRLRNDEDKKLRQEVLERAADLLNEVPRKFVADFNALLMAGAHQLRSNRDLVWVCNQLADGGHAHSLKELGDYVPEKDWLEFLRWVKVRANTDTKIGYGYVHAAEEWPKRKGYRQPSRPLPTVLSILAEEKWPQ